jgi:hypothetical protein
MAMAACRECEQQVSSAADACPHCGVESPSRQRALVMRGTEIAALVALVLLTVGLVIAFG